MSFYKNFAFVSSLSISEPPNHQWFSFFLFLITNIREEAIRRFGFYFCLGLLLAMISWANSSKHCNPQFPQLHNGNVA